MFLKTTLFASIVFLLFALCSGASPAKPYSHPVFGLEWVQLSTGSLIYRLSEAIPTGRWDWIETETETLLEAAGISVSSDSEHPLLRLEGNVIRDSKRTTISLHLRIREKVTLHRRPGREFVLTTWHKEQEFGFHDESAETLREAIQTMVQHLTSVTKGFWGQARSLRDQKDLNKEH